MGLATLPFEVIHEILCWLSWRGYEWGDIREDTRQFMGLRLICQRFDRAVITWFLCELKYRLDPDMLPLGWYTPTPGTAQLCRRLLAEQVLREQGRISYPMIDTIIRTVDAAVDILNDRYSDTRALRATYTHGTIFAVVGFTQVYEPLAHLARTEPWKDEHKFQEQDRHHNVLAVAAALGRVADMEHLIELAADIRFNKNAGWFGPPVLAAAFGGHVDALRFLVDRGINPDSRDKGNGESALHHAATAGHEAVFRYLLSLGVDPDARTDNDDTPILCAAAAGHESIVQLLLEQTIDVNAKTTDGRTALALAVWRRHDNIVKALLEHESIDFGCRDPYNKDSGMLALAMLTGKESMVDMLLANPKFDIHSLDEEGHTILVHAVKGGNEAIVQKVLHLPGIDFNALCSDESTALMCAAKGGQGSIVRLLLAQTGIQVNLRGKGGSTALTAAAVMDNLEATRALLEYPGIEVNILHEDSEMFEGGGSILCLVATAGYEEVTKLLLAHPYIDTNLSDTSSRSPLIRAATVGNLSIVRLLLARGEVHRNQGDADNSTALMWAASCGNADCVQALLEDSNILVPLRNTSQQTALMLAAENGHVDIVKLLLEPNRGFDQTMIVEALGAARESGRQTVELYLSSQLPAM